MLWVSLLLQWVFLFAILTMLFFPAFRFRKLARAHNKKGWVYFVVGLGVGIVALQLGNLVLFCLRYLKPSEGQLRYLWILMFVPWYIFYRFSLAYLKKHFVRIAE